MQNNIKSSPVYYKKKILFRKENKLHYNSFIDTNLIHNFVYRLHKIKFLYMFRASSAHLQEVSLPLASAQDGHLQRMRIPEAAYMYN